MIEAYRVADVRAAERDLMARLPEGELMRRASAGLADVLRARLRPGHRMVALVGPGDNGGDALYAAVALARSGSPVAVVTVSEKVHPGAAAAAAEAGVELVPWSSGDNGSTVGNPRARRLVADADLVVDGILGIGGRPGLSGDLLDLVGEIPPDSYVVAVDLPSGTDPAGEQATADCVFADETVTFGVAKPVHLLPVTELAVGRLTVVDIGLDLSGGDGRDASTAAVRRLEDGDVAALWPTPGPTDDKYARGVLGVVAGGEAYTGAAVLCVTAAVCAGVGMVRYVGPPTPTMLVRTAVPEAVFGPGRVQAWVVGSGLDADDRSPAGRQQVEAALSALDSQEPCLVDAGGLDLLDQPRTAPTLLTPHAGELARMLSRLGRSVDRDEVEARPLEHGRRLADLTGATVLVKGHVVLVAEPGVEAPARVSNSGSSGTATTVRTQPDGPAWLATAGSGDVLAGLAGALLSAGLSPVDAACAATHVHGRAGEAANPGGPLRAQAVAHAIPAVVARLLNTGTRTDSGTASRAGSRRDRTRPADREG